MRDYFILTFLVMMIGRDVAARSSFLQGFGFDNGMPKATCDGTIGTQYCIDCDTVALCNTDGTATPQPCAADSYCVELVRGKTYTAVCEDSTTNADGICLCDDELVATDFFADIYDNTKYYVCIVADPEVIRISRECPAGEIFDPNALTEPPCMSTGPTSSPPGSCEDGSLSYPVLPDCTDYILCSSDGNGGYTEDEKSCATGQWNEVALACQDPTVVVPEVDCTDVPDGTAIADNLDCLRYHICFGDVDVSTMCCTNIGEVFSPELQGCTADVASVTCPKYPICYDTSSVEWCDVVAVDPSSTANAGDSTTANVSPQSSTTSGTIFTCTSEGRFPDEADCHSYYSCVESPPLSGSYIQSHVNCPGDLIFSSTEGMCMAECKILAEQVHKRQTCAICA